METRRGGCAGMIPAPDVTDAQARVRALREAADKVGAKAWRRSVLPLASFTVIDAARGERVAAYRMPFLAKRARIGVAHGRRPGVGRHPLLERRLPSPAGSQWPPPNGAPWMSPAP